MTRLDDALQAAAADTERLDRLAQGNPSRPRPAASPRTEVPWTHYRRRRIPMCHRPTSSEAVARRRRNMVMPLLRLLLGILVFGPLGGHPAVASDHIDGPRSIGDPAADLSDLYAFQSPERTDHTVLIADVFPFAGDSAFFSDAVNYVIAMRRVQVAGLGNEARFQAAEEELQFTCKFEPLDASTSGGKPRQRGACTLPGGRTLQLVVGDERGAATPDGVFRVFAG
jgi:hypothetical protein